MDKTVSYEKALASTAATGMTTSQIKNLIGPMVKNKRATCPAHTKE